MASHQDRTSAEIVHFPRQGFIIGDHLCQMPGVDRYTMCFAPAGHDGDHQWRDWRGCTMRLPEGPGVIPFGGFAY